MKMSKKKIIILCSVIVGVVLCVGGLVFSFTKNNSNSVNNNQETTNNTVDYVNDDVTDNIINEESEEPIDLTEQNTTIPEEGTNKQQTNQMENNNNQNTNQNDNGQTEAQNQSKPSDSVVQPETSAINYGDVNEDGLINQTDTILIRKYIARKQEFTKKQVTIADVNTDNIVDDIDRDILLKFIAGGYGIDKLPYNSGKKYNITYELNGGTVSTNETLRSVYALISDIETLPTLVKDEYVFIGWTGSNGNVPELTVTPQSDAGQNLHYVANWKLYGDVNEDGIINQTDTILIRKYIAKGQYFTQSQQLVADVNDDGVIDDVDVDILLKFIAGGYGIDKLPYKS